jgi:chlorite dismutase
MTLDELIADANKRSVSLYLQRQQLELESHRLNSVRQQVDMALVKLDGEIEAYNKLKAEVKNG